MDQVCHAVKQKRRLWTVQDQTTTEVAAACGVSCAEIGRVLGRSHTLIKSHLDPSLAKKRRENSRIWRNANLEKARDATRQWYASNKDKASEYARDYRQSDPERHKARIASWRAANFERVREYRRRRYESNPERARQLARLWYATNPERARERHRSWCQANHERLQELHRLWRKRNPDKVRERSRRRHALKRAAHRKALQPVTQEQLDNRFALWSDCCAFCGVNATDSRNIGRARLTVEHVLALTKGGLDEASNIIPACTACNSSKHNSPVETWYRRQPFFSDLRWRKIQRHCPAAVVGQLPLAL
jgi:hypothetical protein